jgi:hypothetical protein
MGNGVKKEAIDSKHLKPNGLYTLEWDLKLVKKLILDRKLAPFFPGKDSANEQDSEECPICFLNYSGGLNRTKCCKKGICTECHLMIKKPAGEPSCPFCNRTSYGVIFTGPLSKEERDQEFQEQQKVVELQIKMRQEEQEKDREREKQRELSRSKASAAGDASNQPQSVQSTQSDSNKPAAASESIRTSRSSLKTSRRKDKHRSGEKTPRRDSGPKNEPQLPPSSPALPVVPIVPESVSSSMDNDSGQEDFVAHMISAFNQPRNGGNDLLQAQDLEELMIMEAIRRSLTDVKPIEPKTNKPEVMEKVGSPTAKSDITSSTNTNSTSQSGHNRISEPKDEELDVSETLTNSSFSTNYTNTTTGWEANQHPSLHSDADPSNLTGLSNSSSEEEMKKTTPKLVEKEKNKPKAVAESFLNSENDKKELNDDKQQNKRASLVDVQLTAHATLKPKKEKKHESSSSSEKISSSSSDNDSDSDSDSDSKSESAEEVLLNKRHKNSLKNSLAEGILNTETSVQ